MSSLNAMYCTLVLLLKFKDCNKNKIITKVWNAHVCINYCHIHAK